MAHAVRSPQVQAVEALYAAILRGDDAEVRAALAEQVAWEHGTGSDRVPWVPFLRGRADVTQGMHLDPRIACRFTTVTFFESGRLVTALVDVELRSSAADGAAAAVQAPHTWREAHQWEFDGEGRIVRLRQRSQHGGGERVGATLLVFGRPGADAPFR